MDNSKFNLWRTCFAFCHVDFEVCGEEKKWMEQKLSTLKFTSEQEEILRQDMVKAPNILDLINHITHPADRSFLTHQLRVLSKLDKEFSTREKEKLKKINDFVMAQSNFKEAVATVQKMEMESYHEDEVYKVDNKHSLFERLYSQFLKNLNPGDYKFPKK